jgi:hypothetical protein
MEVLLGSEPVLGPQQRLYQRLLADDADDAISMAVQSVEERLPSKPGQDDRASAVRGFYDEVAIPALRIATQQHLESATAEHRLRLSNGMAALLEELQDQYAFRSRGEHARAASGEDDQRRCLRIHCAGVRWEVDALGAAMVAHAESLHGHEVSCSEWALAPDSKSLQFDVNGLLADREWARAVKQSDLLVLSIFNHQPQSMARRIVRRIRRHWPGARVVLCLWNAPAVAADPDFARQTGAQACVTSLRELHLWVEAMQVGDPGESVIAAPIPDDDEQRVRMLHESGVLAPALTALYRDTAKKAVNAFNTKWALVSWVDAERVFAPGSLLPLSAQEVPQHGFPRDSSVCSYVVYEEEAIVVGDLARDPRFANDSMVHSLKLRFYAGVPLTDKRGNVLGCLSILDDEPRNLSDDELEVLGGMARQLMDDVREALRQGPVVDA